MTLLYRRFMLITALLTVFAGIFANVILQTRSQGTRLQIVQTVPFSSFKTTTHFLSPSTFGSSNLPIEMFEGPCSDKKSCL